MSKRYRETLEDVELAAEVSGPWRDAPVAFCWRGTPYRVLQVLGHWREDPGWWRRPDGEPIRIEQTDLWRVEAGRGAAGGGVATNGRAARGVYELVRRGGQWRLDRVWD